MHFSQKEIEKLEHAIIVKAWKDTKFRERLLKSPNETVREFILKETGKNIDPPDWKFEVIEEKQGTTTIILPLAPDHMTQLSDSELEAVAGSKGAQEHLLGWNC